MVKFLPLMWLVFHNCGPIPNVNSLNPQSESRKIFMMEKVPALRRERQMKMAQVNDDYGRVNYDHIVRFLKRTLSFLLLSVKSSFTA